MVEYRVGTGFDVHAFTEGRKLKIGGVLIDHDQGLAGHSDADVLLHAICDALLGAAALGDVGKHFPPGDPKYKDADSILLLKAVHKKVVTVGWTDIENIDATIMAERPHLQNYIPAMQNVIAAALAMEPTRINIKATTTEKLGFVGREEGIAASAVCLIKKHG
ncbi:MAG: 2-C-methyl-D-erythritol 2,4-cyclodiphosphate synthase [Candidatus Zixiibacteriota bacterium]